jgi:uncharacterized membrane protein YdcZ (DUF606 family)
LQAGPSFRTPHALIDRFGLFGLEKIRFRWERLVGILLLAAGAALSLKRGEA